MNIVLFGYDATEASQIRRIRSFLGLGHDVVAFTMRRQFNPDYEPEWKNIHLATIGDEQLLRRLMAMLVSIVKIVLNIGVVRRADVLVARNLDMLVLASVARMLALRPRLPLIYECLDIHGAMTGTGTLSRLMRACERAILNRCLLVVSAPAFLTEYFARYQGYSGPNAILENKIWFGAELPQRRTTTDNVSQGRPWVLGWVGALRCGPSFEILLETAAALGDRIEVHMHGVVFRHALERFEERIALHPNIRYFGPYSYPLGLRDVYTSCDMVWAQDLWQQGTNSDWLLPNRIYEASYFGCPSIAVATTATGRTIEKDGLGFTVAAPTAEALTQLLTGLAPQEAVDKRRGLLATNVSNFVYAAEELQAVLDKAVGMNGEGA